LKSSTEDRTPPRPDNETGVLVATGLRLRGAEGRLTARLVPGGIDQLEGRDWVLVGRSGGDPKRLRVEEHSSYGDRLVLKFSGVDSAEAAAAFVGQDILIPCNGLVDLPEGSYYIFELVGLTVRTRAGRTIGRVRDVVPTGGTPLLAIEPEEGNGVETHEPILLPAARSICTAIDPASGWITIDPPEGLLELYGL
jgi:16S rRNA processing protein RimM